MPRMSTTVATQSVRLDCGVCGRRNVSTWDVHHDSDGGYTTNLRRTRAAWRNVDWKPQYGTATFTCPAGRCSVRVPARMDRVREVLATAIGEGRDVLLLTIDL